MFISFPFYYYYLLFLTLPSHIALLPVPQFPARDAGMSQGCHPSSLGIFYLAFIPLSKTLSVSGKFPLPYSLRAQICCPHQCLTGVWTKSCSPGRELPSTASHPSFWEDFELPQKPQRAGRQLCDDAVMKQKNLPAIKSLIPLKWSSHRKRGRQVRMDVTAQESDNGEQRKVSKNKD